MIEYIFGKLIEKNTGYSIIDINGLGYKIICSINSYEKLPKLNSKIKFFIHFHVYENGQDLYGFIDKTERELFLMLIGISGIGPKTAINMLSAVPPNEFKNRLIAGEVKMLTSLPGIGPKTARRIIVELKDKFGDVSDNDLPIEDSDFNNDAFYALKNLGFSTKDINNAMIKLSKDKSELSTEEIIKGTLKLLK